MECQSTCGDKHHQQRPIDSGEHDLDECCVLLSRGAQCASKKPKPCRGELRKLCKRDSTNRDSCCLGKEAEFLGDEKKHESVAKKEGVSQTMRKGDVCCTRNDIRVAGIKKEDALCSSESETAKPFEGKACCAETTIFNDELEERSNCCADTETSRVQVSKKGTCSSLKEYLPDDMNSKSACCEAKSETALPDKLSVRSDNCASTSRGSKRRRASTEACNDHLQSAFDKYTGYLEKGLCICRSVLHRLDRCCGKPFPPTSKHEPTSHAESSASATTNLNVYQQSATEACKDVCCSQKTPSIKSDEGRDSSDHSVNNLGINTSRRTRPTARTRDFDIETEAAREHVVLAVAGMTCTGCSRKVTNVLQNIDGVSSIKVTFVTGLAEFDVDSKIVKAEQMLPRIEKETGFKYSRIVSTYQVLDLRIDPANVEDTCTELEKIVESVEKLDKRTYRVNYDPASIGARTILESVRGISLAPPGIDATVADGRRRLINMGWSTAVAAMLTIPIVVLAWSHNPVTYATKSMVSLILATFVQGIAVPEFYIGALKSLIYSRVVEMDMLIVIGITAAYGYSVIAFALTHAGYTLETEEFFETSSLLITLVLLGRLVAAVAKVRAVSAVSLRSLQAEKALLVSLSGVTSEIDARLLQFGDTFLVPGHARIVTDGEIVHGRSAIDESMLTGENVPVLKSPEMR